MMRFMKALFVFPLHFALQIFNLCFWGGLIIVLGIVKLIPLTFLRQTINPVIANFEIAFGVCSISLLKFFNRINIDYRVSSELSKDQWYLVTVNHRSYLDVILVMDFAYQRIQAPKFFLKKELIWLPVVGLGAWALDMPFMQRFSKAQITKNPNLAGKDIETTRKKCKKYKSTPTTVVNFAEGTRFTLAKHQEKQPPYTHLLRPKAAGLAFTLNTMGEQFTELLDITLIYPENEDHPMMDMLCGRMKQIIIDVRSVPISNDLRGNYDKDEDFKAYFQQWLNTLWANKDRCITSYLNVQDSTAP